ncbi:TonB-dependent receptor domain-containing protein [Flavicella sediminum]|uniref:TonB-dependent receptor domain-containing protein n=1 Tax=Flavicella sediminum TaxID=2585141 RepID=UPI00111D436A|nr:TonB-dependent receptor [Flavicella sediminum]
MSLKQILLFTLILVPALIFSQEKLTVKLTINSEENLTGISNAQVYLKSGKDLGSTDENGMLFFEAEEGKNYQIVVFSFEYKIFQTSIIPTKNSNKYSFELAHLGENLDEVHVSGNKRKFFNLVRLKNVEGTAIYAGKKTEVVLVDQIVGNLASNNARQVMAQVVGLNIFDAGDGGLQLSIGGRGLDPNRTSNFNTRQNDYDISADVLGYPESYYTPPAEALSEIQVIRGAASLQYGTQFGGLINFKLKEPVKDKEIEVISRQNIGSYGLFTSFNSISGTVDKKFSYYAYYNYKKGDGYRANSNFDSKNLFAQIGYQFSEKTKLVFETTYLDYLAKQSGGLSDKQFLENPRQSNRTRNWFAVNWQLMALKFTHKFSEQTDFSFNLFSLNANRKALGFRTNPNFDNPNALTDIDEMDSNGDFLHERDLLVGQFRNWGIESRLLTRYHVGEKDAVFLIGAKLYKANNSSEQGSGSKGVDADFSFYKETYPDYSSQSSFKYPNFNVAIFGENIFNLSDSFSLTPGFRFEYIKTISEGAYLNANTGNFVDDNNRFNRNILLLGLGASYKPDNYFEAYANISQNYRSVTFSDIRVTSPSFSVADDITDEKGFTSDIGVRGKIGTSFSYDSSVFGLLYDGKIGTNFEDRIGWIRDNIGTAVVYGFETLLDWNIKDTFWENSNYKLNTFVNIAFTDSEYTKSKFNGVEGKKVEFIPFVNLKTGIGFGYKNFLGSLQYSYLSQQYTDVTNAEYDPHNNSSVKGAIPAYDILDFSVSYVYKNIKLETGINNVLNKSYFTRRATGYPGPGIITSDPATYYLTVQFKI